MRRLAGILMLAGSLAAAGAVIVRAQQGVPPPWAYGFTMPPPATPPGGAPAAGGRGGGAAGAPQAGRGGGAPAPPDETLHTLPGSTQKFTLAQIRNQFGPADWYPGDHPAMPPIVASGRMPDVRACSLCHYPNGKGRPENAPVAGLPVSYFIQQMQDFKTDKRKSADPRKGNTNIMITIAKGMTDEEIRQSAEYFGSMPWSQWITVKEVSTVPKTRIAGGMFLDLADGMTEPIGNRIIETPEHTERTETLRDPRAGFIAYVPMGSIKAGQTLVTTGGGGKTVACATCHGADLKGMGPVPGIAGRSPSYTVRQMFDMQAGTRNGEWTTLMKPVVAKLTDTELLQIAAYTASLKP
jgi:cytochrome c553